MRRAIRLASFAARAIDRAERLAFARYWLALAGVETENVFGVLRANIPASRVMIERDPDGVTRVLVIGPEGHLKARGRIVLTCDLPEVEA